MTRPGPAPTRSWAGTTLADRQADRRRRFLDAGLELLGNEGAAAVSVRSLCRLAGLTDRYFYENFADRDGLLVAVYDQVAEDFSTALLGVLGAGYTDDETLARAAMDAFVDVMEADPRKGRVLLLEPMAVPALAAHGLAVSPVFVALVSSRLGEPGGEAAATAEQTTLAAHAAVGALTTLFIRWLDGTLPVSRQTLCGFCVRLLLNARTLAG